MLEVFAIKTVRSMRDLPDFESTRFGKSSSTSVISFPRSPQPIYTMISASLHLASWCCVMVFPVPKPPGMAAVPPFAMGKNVSMTRCPVIKGTSIRRRFAKGLGLRTGQYCSMLTSRLPLSVSTSSRVSSTLYKPSCFTLTIRPLIPLGIISLCKISSVSWTEAKIMPGNACAPDSTQNRTGHSFARSIG